jgi:hypothetical protein
MSHRSLVVLVLLGVLSLAGGWWLGPGRSPAAVNTADAGRLMFPGLAERLPEARRVEIVHQGKTLAIERRGGDDAAWGLADRGLYPIQTGVLRGLLTGLTELRLVEPRTADSGKYARLGVEDPDAPDGTSHLLRVLDGNGKPMAEVILGHRRVRTRGNLPESVYVRMPGQAQSWLAEGKLAVSADPQTLIDRDIIGIAAARIMSVVVTRGTVRLEFARDGDKLALTSPAEHPPLDPSRLDDVAGALDNLTLLDVRRPQQPSPAPLGHTVFTAIDGLVIDVSVFNAGKELWARFAVSGPPAIAADVQALETRLHGWEYQLGAWKEKSLLPTLDDLKPEPPAKP